MKTFITDMGKEKKNSIIEDLCKNLKTESLTSTAHHHQTVGTVERSHRTFNEFIRSYISLNKSDKDAWLPYFTHCFNIHALWQMIIVHMSWYLVEQQICHYNLIAKVLYIRYIT